MKIQPLFRLILYEVLIIFMLYLHLAHLAWVPGWYPDEGSDINIAKNLGQGRFQYFAIQGTPLVAARTPLFHLSLILAAKFLDYDIFTARLVVAIYNLLTVLALYLVVKQMFNEQMALLTITIWVLTPTFLLYHRMAFTYNVQTLFYVLGWWASWRFAETLHGRWLFLAALAAAAAYMAAPIGLGLVLAMALIVLWYRPRWLFWFLPVAALPGLAYIALLYLRTPQSLLEDLSIQSFRGGGFSALSLLSNYKLWFDWAGWIGLGVIGLLGIDNKRIGRITQFIFFVNLIFVMRFGPGELSFHRFLQLLPFVAFGAANLLLKVGNWLTQEAEGDAGIIAQRLPMLMRYRPLLRQILVLGMWMLVLSFVVTQAVWDFGLIGYGKSVPFYRLIDDVLVHNPADALAVTDYVNQRIERQDIVLASPHIAWRIRANATDFEQFLAYQGLFTNNFAYGVAKERFEFPLLLEKTKFVIVDNMWTEWAVGVMPLLEGYLRQIESWDLVLKRGNFKVYRNPAYP